MERCENDTVSLILGEGNHCKSYEEIKELILPVSGVNLFYIDNYIDVLNYKNPITKFFNKIENGLQLNKYPLNNINLNPINLKSYDGLILDNIKIEKSYIFERNDAYTYENKDPNFFSLYCIYLKNNMNYYERNYKRIQDVISDIGGIYQIIKIFSDFINKFYNKYIILNNIENLLYFSINSEKHNNKHKKSRNQIKNLENEHKKTSINIKLNEEKFKDNLNPIENDITISKSNNNFNKFENKNKEKKENIEKIKDKKYNNNKNKILNFYNYVLFILSCGKKKNSFEIYDIFRKKIISEEHLIKIHLNIYNLLRVNEKKRNFRRNSYQLKDLLKLI